MPHTSIPTFLQTLKASGDITFRQYIFAAGLASSYLQMKNSSRNISSDDAAKSMFYHLVDLVKPTCLDVKIDITAPGSVSKLQTKESLTRKLG